ncbi:Uncharacterized protein BP5553_00155 [Venustampulla echinocandica]|uniref:AP complex subunit sigma n=1 Tax=Venustampulla echinocandica TaxID=2656787 RepID=A0A370TXB5_9HELO|nr:Uncharacterized protein BP5553_00155 [Venustampulla echinocandica]RDL40176.1 Uncharacterized protein BP5553_00155 [Venustampulla echinocandica]
MISAVLVFNNSGQPRLTKFYTQLVPFPLFVPVLFPHHQLKLGSYDDISDTAVQQRLISEIFSLVSNRPSGSCNFLPLPPLLASSGTSHTPSSEHNDTPSLVTYRHYATLYFIIISTSTESPLALIDLIQVYVEALDRLFENVCELDLIFNFETLHAALSEMIVGGVVIETQLDRVVEGVKAQGKVAKRPVNEGRGAGPLGMGGNFAWPGR